MLNTLTLNKVIYYFIFYFIRSDPFDVSSFFFNRDLQLNEISSISLDAFDDLKALHELYVTSKIPGSS